MNFLDYVDAPMCISTGIVTLASGVVDSPPNNGGGAAAMANGAAIQSKYRGPLLINEMEFIAAVNSSSSTRLIDPRASLRVSVQAGRMALTNDFIPMGLLGLSGGLPTSFATQYYGLEDVSPQGTGGAIAAGVPEYASTYWRFPKPLFYPPGLGFTIRYARNINDPWIGQLPISIDCVVRGYYMRPDMPYPTEIDVPYATGGSFAVMGSSFVTEQTARTPNEEQYKNPFPVPLCIQRITARYYQNPSWSSSQVPIWNFTDGANPVNYAATVKMTKQNGDVLVPNAVPLWEAFDYRRQGWNVATVLQPNEKIDIRMNTFFGQINPTGPVNGMTFHGFPQIGLIGHRKEVLQ